MTKPDPNDPRVRPDPRTLPPDAVVYAHRGYYCVVVGKDPAPREAVAILDRCTELLTMREREEAQRAAREASYLRERG